MVRDLRLLVLFLFCTSLARESLANVVADTCKKTSDFNLCVSTLNSNPKSATADVKGLAIVFFEEVGRYASVTANQVADLLKNTTDPVTKECLQICNEQYDLTLHVHIPDGISSLEKNNLLPAKTANAAIGDDATTCEDSFGENPKSPRKSPLTTRNNMAFRLSVILGEILISMEK